MSNSIKSQLVTSFVICLLIILFISSFFTGVVGSQINTPENEDLSGTRGARQGEDDMRVYFHEDNILNTIEGNKTILNPTRTTLNDADSVFFTLTPALRSDLLVSGTDLGGGEFGFEIYLEIQNINPSHDNIEITFKILDGNTIIATNTDPVIIPGGQNAQNHEIPFVDTLLEVYTFNNNIMVNISASFSGTTSALISYDRGLNDGYLELNCEPISKIDIAAHHADNTLGVFYPNLPYQEQRFIKFKGSVSDKFGSYDVNRVEISLSNTFDHELANYTPSQEEIGYFELDYSYDTGMASGIYTMTAHIYYNSERFEKSGTNTFTMAEFGVYLECENNTAEGFNGETVSFKIDVYNVGSGSDSIKLTAEPDPVNWGTNFPDGATTSLLGPGHVSRETFEVTVPADAGKNEDCEIKITGNSVNNNAEDYKLDPLIQVVAKPPFGYAFNILNAPTQDISAGQAAVYTFNLQNMGSEIDTYNVKGDTPPISSNWTAGLDCDNSAGIRVSDTEFDIFLGAGELASFTFTVTSPNDPIEDQMILNVISTAENISEPSKKTITQTTTTNIDTGPSPPGEVTLSSQSTTATADPGDTIDSSYNMQVVFDLTAENEDEVNQFSVDIELINAPSTWDVSITPSDFSLAPLATKDISLIIDIPENEDADTYEFKAKANYGAGKTAILDLKVIIPEVYNILLETSEKDKSITVGKTVEYDISITNKGNVKGAKIELTLNDESGWEVELDRVEITLGEFDSLSNVKISFTPSDSVDVDKKGIFDVQAKSKDTGKIISNKLTLKITVEKDTGEQLANFFYNYWFVPVMVIIIIVLTLVIRSRLK